MSWLEHSLLQYSALFLGLRIPPSFTKNYFAPLLFIAEKQPCWRMYVREDHTPCWLFNMFMTSNRWHCHFCLQRAERIHLNKYWRAESVQQSCLCHDFPSWNIPEFTGWDSSAPVACVPYEPLWPTWECQPAGWQTRWDGALVGLHSQQLGCCHQRWFHSTCASGWRISAGRKRKFSFTDLTGENLELE